MAEPHRTTIRVRFYELDPYNHVNHSVYVSYFESARVELLAEVGYSLASMRAAGRSIARPCTSRITLPLSVTNPSRGRGWPPSARPDRRMRCARTRN